MNAFFLRNIKIHRGICTSFKSAFQCKITRAHYCLPPLNEIKRNIQIGRSEIFQQIIFNALNQTEEGKMMQIQRNKTNFDLIFSKLKQTLSEIKNIGLGYCLQETITVIFSFEF